MALAQGSGEAQQPLLVPAACLPEVIVEIAEDPHAAAAGAPEPELIHYEPAEFDFGKAKAFPLRSQHFFTSIEKAKADLGWAPKYGLLDGLTHSYANDFGLGNFRK